jgi:hypothetical protein
MAIIGKCCSDLNAAIPGIVSGSITAQTVERCQSKRRKLQQKLIFVQGVQGVISLDNEEVGTEITIERRYR